MKDLPEARRRVHIDGADVDGVHVVRRAADPTVTTVSSRTADRSRIEASGWPSAALDAARVLVVGAGAIGNEVLKTLALLGVRHVLIVDLDDIEASNLTRSILFRPEDVGRAKADVAREAVLRIEPSLRVHAVQGRIQDLLGTGAFRRFDLVFCCVDNLAARIYVAGACAATRTPMIEGGVDRLSGTASIMFPPETACFDCGLYEATRRKALQRHPCEGIRLGDDRRPTIPFTPTITSIIAGVMAQWGMQCLAGRLDRSRALTFSFTAGDDSSMVGTLSKSSRCPTHAELEQRDGSYACVVDGAITGTDWSLDRSGGDVLEEARKQRDVSRPLELHLGYDLVTGLVCDRCGFSKPLIRRRENLVLADAVCENRCQATDVPMRLVSQGYLHHEDGLAALSLRDLQLRPLDLVGVNDPATGEMVTYELGSGCEIFGKVDFGSPR